MMPYRQRDLLLVPIPFSDLTSHKVRPVVVLSNDSYNGQTSDMLVAGVTSNLSARSYTVALDTPDLDEGTLRYPSLVRADKIFSIDQGIVRARFGSVNHQTFRKICDQIQALMTNDS